jgi:phosphoenolpyruvate carboxykinase (GTP)
MGQLRRDPFAMLPFCGYNMADYWAHWLRVGEFTSPEKLPRIFAVNWFRKGADGKFLWPGYGENARVLDWVIGRLGGVADFVESPIGRLPAQGALPLEGLALSADQLEELFAVSPDSWLAECDLTAEYYAMFGDRVPTQLHAQLADLRERLATA